MRTIGNSGCHRGAFFRLCLPVFVFVGVLAMGLPAWALDGGDWEDEEDEENSLPSFMKIRAEPPPIPAALSNEAQPSPWRTFELAGGAVYSTLESLFTMTHGHIGTGLAVNAEDLLGMKKELWSPDAWVSIRLGNRHRLKLHYSDFTRTADRILQATITVNGNSFTAGTDVNSVFGIQQFDLSYVFSFLKDDRMEIGVTLHVDLIRLHVAVDAGKLGSTNNERWLLPVPIPGFDADFILIKDVWLRQEIGASYIPLSNYTGIVLESSTALEWSFLENLSLGLGFQFMRVDLIKKTEDGRLGNFDGKFRFSVGGVFAYLNIHF
jgi:hypothetical protein